jgi:hypothetical protein
MKNEEFHEERAQTKDGTIRYCSHIGVARRRYSVVNVSIIVYR